MLSPQKFGRVTGYREYNNWGLGLVCRGGVGGGCVVMIDSFISTHSGLVISLKSLGK